MLATAPEVTTPPDAPLPAASTLPLPYRVEGETVWLLDQLAYPGAVHEIACTTLSDLSMAMLARQVSGAPLLAEITAFGLWLALVGARGASVAMKRTRLRTTGAALTAVRSNVATIPWATSRMVAAWDAAVEDTQDEPVLEAAMRTAAEDIARQMRSDVVTLGQTGTVLFSGLPGETFEMMLLGSTGYPGALEAGGAAGIAAGLAKAGMSVHVWIVEAPPVDDGHLTAWGLAQSGIPTTVLANAAAGWMLATRRIDAIMVGADRITLEGEVTAAIGTYGLAALASRHSVPVFVAAPLATIDPGERDVTGPGVEWEPSPAVDPNRPQSARLATHVGSRGALQDVTPPDLIDGIVTESGLLTPPFAASIASALGRTLGP